jgi:hypothetical protein
VLAAVKNLGVADREMDVLLLLLLPLSPPLIFLPLFLLVLAFSFLGLRLGVKANGPVRICHNRNRVEKPEK